MPVEDDAVDMRTLKSAIKDITVTNNVIVASDGTEALTYLMEGGDRRPGIILSDITMPGMHGIKFLAEAKKNGVLTSIPVAVLTASRADTDAVDSFDPGVAGYMVKPVRYSQFVEVMKTISLYRTIPELPDG